MGSVDGDAEIRNPTIVKVIREVLVKVPFVAVTVMV